jgi:dTDP-4-dehydrorhamnose 3,5-epimerase
MTSGIDGIYVRSLKQYTDSRGWLMEMFREDELPEGFTPAMGYLSVTHPGVARGPHAHHHQTDGFCFLDGMFQVTLWENRPGREPVREDHLLGKDDPVFMTVPPGVVHAYRNVGETDAFVVNLPDALYAGRGRSEPVDEIRYEETESEFKL